MFISVSRGRASLIASALNPESEVSVGRMKGNSFWQNRSIRGFVSGYGIKKMGLERRVQEERGGERTYRIVG